MKILITGISGQDGAYLSKRLLEQGNDIRGIIRNENSNIDGLKYLNIEKEIEFEKVDLADRSSIEKNIKKHQYDQIYNLAAQSSVAESFKNPFLTMQFNVQSTLNILESVKKVSPHTKIYQATSSEMYGDVRNLPINENTLLNPQSPYAISKAACHYLIKNYREAYQIHASSGILFNHESVLRRENFFIMKLIKSALDILNRKQEMLKLGNIEIKRDFGYAPDYIEAIVKMLEQDEPGDYMICSGKSITLRSIVEHIFRFLNISMDKIVIDPELYRPSEIENIYGDNNKAKERLGWKYDRSFFDVIEEITVEYEKNFYAK
ncbi:MAG: GDP-mannose 4,6-dehydratase [Flavobacteriales bacterium]|nr:GDP-mannose 4,6-dehydratase [Flavobacteriales bacterium]